MKKIEFAIFSLFLLALTTVDEALALAPNPNPYIFKSNEPFSLNCNSPGNFVWWGYGVNGIIDDGDDCTGNELFLRINSALEESKVEIGLTIFIFEFSNPVDESCSGITSQACINAKPPGLIEYRTLLVVKEAIGRIGFINYHPQIKILSPNEESKIGNTIEIKYEASDQNDANEKAIAGLKENPVSIYYAPSYDTSARTLIAKDLPAVGTYIFDASGLAEDFYKIIVKAEDVAGQPGEAVSPVLFLDNVAPVFRITAEPPVTRGEDVKIIVESSEDLSELPVATIVQKNSTIAVSPKLTASASSASFSQIGGITRLIETGPGAGNRFEGVFQVAKGFDGPAKITVSGKDRAGNVGTKIVGGGYFSVGIEPPSRPIVLAPLDKDIFASDSITVIGTARDDTEVLLLVNGKDEYRTKPDGDGNFIFQNIDISSKENQGLNFLSITSRDATGALSEPANLTIKFNLIPEASFVTPLKDDVLGGLTTIKIDAKDKNNDRLLLTYEVSDDNGENWTVIADKTTSRQYTWNTTKHNDGEYLLRVTIDDGFSKQQIISEKFFVSNFLPVIKFDVPGDKLIFNTNEAVISGLVKTVTEKEGEARPTVKAMEYALSGAEEWTAIPAQDGAYNSFEEGFTLRLSGLSESNQVILFRAQDSRGLYGRAKRMLIVDFGPPAVPVVLSPAANSVLSNADDQDPNTAGVQFSVNGTAEPGSTVTADVLTRQDLVDQVLPGKSGRTGADGRFAIEGVTLRKHGLNSLKIYTIDPAGNKSPETALTLIYNNPPDLKLLNPRAGRGLNHKAEIRWEAVDPDGDKVRDVRLSYRLQGGTNRYFDMSKCQNFDKCQSFAWDVSSLPEGRYQLKLEATDGTSPAEKVVDFSIDNIVPRIELAPLVKNVFTKEFVLYMSGKAFDNFSGIEFVEFSVDPFDRFDKLTASKLKAGGEHWFKTTITRGFLAKEAAFRISHKLKLEDGIYNVRFRAIDAAGNLSSEAVQKVVVDTKPPRVGSYTISDGAITLLPESGKLLILDGQKVDFKISLETDVRTASLSLVRSDLDRSEVGLAKNNATGLWEAKPTFQYVDISSKDMPKIRMLVSAEDVNGNVTKDKEIGQIEVIQKGRVVSEGNPIEGAKVTVQVFDQDSRSFVDWQAEPYGKENPVFTDNNGEYSFLLPAGKYQLAVKREGFQRLRTGDIVIGEPKFINADLTLDKREGFRGFIEDILENLSE